MNINLQSTPTVNITFHHYFLSVVIAFFQLPFNIRFIFKT